MVLMLGDRWAAIPGYTGATGATVPTGTGTGGGTIVVAPKP